jgi:L-lactate permease
VDNNTDLESMAPTVIGYEPEDLAAQFVEGFVYGLTVLGLVVLSIVVGYVIHRY